MNLAENDVKKFATAVAYPFRYYTINLHEYLFLIGDVNETVNAAPAPCERGKLSRDQDRGIIRGKMWNKYRAVYL